MITREQVKDIVFTNCPEFEIAWQQGIFNDGSRFFIPINDNRALESNRLLLQLALYLVWLLLEEKYKEAQQVCFIVEKLHQGGTEGVIDDITFYFSEILYLKTRETQLLTERIELLLSKETLKWYELIKIMPCFNQ